MLVVEVGLIINYIIFLSEGKYVWQKNQRLSLCDFDCPKTSTQNRGREGRGLNLWQMEWCRNDVQWGDLWCTGYSNPSINANPSLFKVQYVRGNRIFNKIAPFAFRFVLPILLYFPKDLDSRPVKKIKRTCKLCFCFMMSTFISNDEEIKWRVKIQFLSNTLYVLKTGA